LRADAAASSGTGGGRAPGGAAALLPRPCLGIPVRRRCRPGRTLATESQTAVQVWIGRVGWIRRVSGNAIRQSALHARAAL